MRMRVPAWEQGEATHDGGLFLEEVVGGILVFKGNTFLARRHAGGRANHPVGGGGV